MSQVVFKNPIVSVSPVVTGTGNGTCTIDRLTHFTIAQVYTLTCVAKTPDTVFSVSGSLDGSIGVAVIGQQFFDQDLKIFFTLQQGATAFEVGDQITFTVVNGTDLNQQNIDIYDELPQKNFGVGLLGAVRGDNNVRYLSTAAASYLYLQDLLFQAVTAGSTGDGISLQYAQAIPAVKATLVAQDLTFTAVAAGTGGNSITFQYINYTVAQQAQLIMQDILYQAFLPGASGNNVSIRYTSGGTAGSEIVSVIGNAVTVQIQSGVSTANQIITAVHASSPAMALLATVAVASGHSGSTAQVTQSATFLAGGANAIGAAGSEVVTVVGNAITVQMQGGVSTATQIRAAILASSPAVALITPTISGTGGNAQTTTPGSATPLAGGANSIGVSAPSVSVTSNAIEVFFLSGVHTATQIKSALDGSGPAAALISTTILGNASDPQQAPVSATFLSGGKNKFYSFNHGEQSDAGAFVEGNTGIKVRDITALGKLKQSGPAEFDKSVLLANSAEGDAVPGVQDYINRVIQEGKISLRTADHSSVSWSKPTFSFTADLVINFNDSNRYNSIVASNSPITIADGSSLYVILDRASNASLTPIVAASVPTIVNAFRLATRYGDNLILWDNTFVGDGRSVRIGEGGSGGTTRVDLYDPVTTTLPSGASFTIDGVNLTNGKTVLFSNLSSGNNRVYKAAGVGSGITWTQQSVFSTGAVPIVGDDVIVNLGTGFGLARGIFDGTTFKFNDVVRFFSGTDYWELSSLKTTAMLNNTTGNVFTVAVAGSENMIVNFSILRGATKITGQIQITSDGTTANCSPDGAYIGSNGVTLFTDVSAGLLRLRFTTDNSGSAATMKYFVQRWSDSAGGPGGIPSYTGGGGGGGGATVAGSDTEIQFNDGGFLGADPDFTWDSTNNILTLAGRQYSGSIGPITLTDATPTGTAFTYDATSFRFAVIEFSIVRNGAYKIGKLLIVNDGTNVSICPEGTDTADTGITFSAAVVLGNVEVYYASTSTGFNGVFQYAFRRWS